MTLKINKMETNDDNKAAPSVDVPSLVRLVLTHEQAEALSEALNEYQDRGPQGEGWASKGLQELRSLVEDAIEQSLPNGADQLPPT